MPFGEDYSLPVDELADSGASLVIVCNPNAPSGTLAGLGKMSDLADKLKGNLHVRFTKGEEDFAALDDNTYKVGEGIPAICDESGVVALGGIIGGRGGKLGKAVSGGFIVDGIEDTITAILGNSGVGSGTSNEVW